MSNSSKISIIIPVYNEEVTLREVLKQIRGVDYGDYDFELLVVDDGSKDGTKKILDSIHDPKIKVFHKKNGGKGSAVIEGLRHVTGNIVVIQDADLEYDPNEIPKLARPIEEGKARVVYGSRFLGSIEYMPLPNRIANWLLTAMNNVFYQKRLTDACTCYKVLDSRLVVRLNLQDTGFDICNEITAKLCKNNEPITELPIKYNSARSNEEGKKAKWWNLLKSIWAVIRYRFSATPIQPATANGHKKVKHEN